MTTWEERLNAAVDQALAVADGVADRRLAAIRAARPGITPAQATRLLEREFAGLTVTTGAGTGLAAAVPVVGLPGAIGLAGVDLVTFLTAAAAHSLAVARVHGQDFRSIERQRALVLAVLVGNAGGKVVLNTVGRTGVRWGQSLAATLPLQLLKRLNTLLGGMLVRKFGPKAGLVAVVKTIPLGLGAVIGGTGNFVLGREVIHSTREAFGEPPARFPADGDEDPFDPDGDGPVV